jgi:cell division protein FtsL
MARAQKLARKKPASPADAGGNQYWKLTTALVLILSFSALSVVWTTHENRVLLDELQQLEDDRNALQVEWGQLLLEQSSLVSQGKLETRAMEELGLKEPALEKEVVIITRD